MAARKNPRQPKNLAEERLKSVLELSSDWYWEQDENLRFTLFSGKNQGEAGFEPASLIGRTRWEIPGARFDPDERTAVQAKLDARAPFIDHEYEHVGPDGQTRTISASGVPVFDKSGAFRGYRGVSKNITERKRDRQLLSLEHAVNRSLAETESVAGALEAAIRAVCETEGWECGRYFRVDEAAGALRFEQSWGVPDPAIQEFLDRSNQRSRDFIYKPGVGLMGKVWQSGQPLWVADVTKDARALPAAFTVDSGIHGGFVFPVKSEGKTIGVLVFNSRDVRDPEERLLQAVEVIGSQIGQFLRRKREEDEHRRFRAAMDVSADALMLINRATLRFVDANRTACEMLGYSREELLQVGPVEIAQVSKQEIERAYDDMIATGATSKQVHLKHLRKDGSWFPAEVSRRAVRSDDGWFIVTNVRDVTGRLAAEESLRRFRVAMDNSADIIVLIDRTTMRFVDVNETACRLLGYSREELLEMGPQDVLPTSREELERAYDEFIEHPSHTPGMHSHYRRKDGSTFPFESTRRVLRSGDGYVIAAISRDISARIAAEEGLLRFRAALDTSADMIMLVDRATMRYIDVNATACEMQGYTREEMLQLGPQDVSPVSREILERAYDESIATGRTTELQSHHRRKDGTQIPVEVFRRAVHTGERWIIVAIVRDITERVAAQAALRESEERFRSLTGLSSDMYWEQDQEFRFTSMTGSERINARSSQSIGRKRWEQNYTNMTADQWAEHIAVLEAHRPFRDLELCRLDSSGNKVWINISGEPVFDAAGVFKGYRGVGKNITERKHDEERIRFLANHDSLTTLPNRAMFSELLNLAIQNARRYNRSFAVLFIDLDSFKNINDTLGHEAGDKVLQEMGTRLTDTVRSGDMVARLGGDEFVVLVQEVSEPEQVAAVARKVLSALVRPMVMQDEECRVTASIGICLFPSGAQDETALMKNADIAMYRAKEGGKNTYKFYSEKIDPLLRGDGAGGILAGSATPQLS